MKIKTAELTGPQLAFAVALSFKMDPDRLATGEGDAEPRSTPAGGNYPRERG